MPIWLIKHWRPLAAAAVLAILAGLWQADRAHQYRLGAEHTAASIKAKLAEAERKHAAQAQRASAQYQAEKTKRENKERIRYVEVQKIVERPVYRSDCLDADGLRQLNSAIGAE